MDWYFGSAADDFVVPKDQEVSDRLPSPQSWSKWGISEPQNFELPNICFAHDANLAQAEFNFNGKHIHNEVEMETCSHDKDHPSGLSVGESSEECLHQTGLSYQQDYQIDGLTEIEMDDIFLYKRNFWD